MTFARKLLAATALVSALAFGAGPAAAGPFILAGTDADDHGSVAGGVNQTGWKFMQRAIENLAPGVTNGNNVVVSLGSDASTQAGNAAASAFGLSSLVAAGWSFVSVNGVAAINTFFGVGGGAGAAGIIMLDSSDNNVSGGLDFNERAALVTNAVALDNFLGAGGGLFSQANGYGFLTALIPTLGVINTSNTGINLTPAGNSAFPGLSDSDLSSGPYHSGFTNVGAISVLGISAADGNAIIIGASGGSIIAPTPVPEPATMLLLGAGLAGLGLARRRKA